MQWRNGSGLGFKESNGLKIACKTTNKWTLFGATNSYTCRPHKQACKRMCMQVCKQVCEQLCKQVYKPMFWGSSSLSAHKCASMWQVTDCQETATVPVVPCEIHVPSTELWNSRSPLGVGLGFFCYWWWSLLGMELVHLNLPVFFSQCRTQFEYRHLSMLSISPNCQHRNNQNVL